MKGVVLTAALAAVLSVFGAEKLIKGYRNPLGARIPGHGFNPFLMPPYDRGDAGWMDKFSEKKSVADGCLHFEVYDSGAREWLFCVDKGVPEGK